jgi:hypothetical protein
VTIAGHIMYHHSLFHPSIVDGCLNYTISFLNSLKHYDKIGYDESTYSLLNALHVAFNYIGPIGWSSLLCTGADETRDACIYVLVNGWEIVVCASCGGSGRT